MLVSSMCWAALVASPLAAVGSPRSSPLPAGITPVSTAPDGDNATSAPTSNDSAAPEDAQWVKRGSDGADSKDTAGGSAGPQPHQALAARLLASGCVEQAMRRVQEAFRASVHEDVIPQLMELHQGTDRWIRGKS